MTDSPPDTYPYVVNDAAGGLVAEAENPGGATTAMSTLSAETPGQVVVYILESPPIGQTWHTYGGKDHPRGRAGKRLGWGYLDATREEVSVPMSMPAESAGP